VTTNAWATQATVGPERFIRGRFYPLHLHRHAFVTPHLRDRSGRCATAVVMEIAAGSAPPDRRRRWMTTSMASAALGSPAVASPTSSVHVLLVGFRFVTEAAIEQTEAAATHTG